nr:glycoside hydrolase family 3 C-terminal domain-containing protein [uncultured Duganella sp.]
MTASTTNPFVTPAAIDALLDAMTINEQVTLLAGVDTWHTAAVPRLGVPAVKLSDGPNGARGDSIQGGALTACFPAGIALGATWNVALLAEVGRALARETLDKGARVLLAPTVNLPRSPLNGRNFECYSEDPWLTAALAAGFIGGVQGAGVAATIKHFVGNESEIERMTISSEIDERTLREVYLRPFEHACAAGVWAMMCSYNRLGGVHTSEHRRLLTGILRDEWRFDGVLMSDWFATHSTAPALEAGLDLEMPGPSVHRGALLLAALARGEVTAAQVRQAAGRVLTLLNRVGASTADANLPERGEEHADHRALIRRAGAEGCVLLKNAAYLLPLDPAMPRTIALIGPNAATARVMGGGSAQVNAHRQVSLYEGLLAHGLAPHSVEVAPGCGNERMVPVLDTALRVRFHNSADPGGPVVAERTYAGSEAVWFGAIADGVDPDCFSAVAELSYTPERDGDYALSLVSAGRSRLYIDDALVADQWDGWRAGAPFFGFGNDEARQTLHLDTSRRYRIRLEYSSAVGRPLVIKALRLGLALPLGAADLAHAEEVARRCDVAIVCVGLNSEWDTEGRDRPDLALPGRQDELVARVAAANPRTIVLLQSGGPVAMPWIDAVDTVLQAWYPGQECGHALADVLFGLAEPGGRLPQSFPRLLEHAAPHQAGAGAVAYPGVAGSVQYAEGIFSGYRHHQRAGIAPLFAFGHGLSYTRFAYTDLRLDRPQLAPGERLGVSLELRNTGPRAGVEVVQLYVRDPASTLERPERELKAFAKVWLEAGAAQRVHFSLDMRDLAAFDVDRNAWWAERGRFEVMLGGASDNIALSAGFDLVADWLQTP